MAAFMASNQSSAMTAAVAKTKSYDLNNIYQLPAASINHESSYVTTGKVHQKVEPSPNVLSTPTSPWCSAMSMER